MEEKIRRKMTWSDKLADKITSFCGNMRFVYFHAVWFGAWILLNSIGWKYEWDSFPYGFLTLVVSLEAIFLATFILITENRETRQQHLRLIRDYEVDRKSAKDIQKIIEMLEEILKNQKQLKK